MHKLALVTGSSRRIGREICLKLASDDYSLILHYCKDHQGIDLLKNELVETYPTLQFFIFQGDLRSPTFVEELSRYCLDRYLIVNLVIHNASIFEADNLSTITYNALQENFSVHLFQPLLITKWFSKQVSEGQIITILDQAISSNKSNYWSYILSKKSLLDATKMIAIELAPKIRVNTILPGMILPSKHGTPDEFQEVVEQTPLKKAPGMTSILATIDYLLINDWATGQMIYCDSGEHWNM